jgi:hypothetical protein
MAVAVEVMTDRKLTSKFEAEVGSDEPDLLVFYSKCTMTGVQNAPTTRQPFRAGERVFTIKGCYFTSPAAS